MAGAGPHVLLDAGVVVGVGGGDDLFSVEEMGLAKGMERFGQLVGVLWGQIVSCTMFGCAGSEVTVAIVGTHLHNSNCCLFLVHGYCFFCLLLVQDMNCTVQSDRTFKGGHKNFLVTKARELFLIKKLNSAPKNNVYVVSLIFDLSIVNSS